MKFTVAHTDNQMRSAEKFCGQANKRLSYLFTMTRGMFEGVNVRLSNTTALYQLSSTVVVVK